MEAAAAMGEDCLVEIHPSDLRFLCEGMHPGCCVLAGPAFSAHLGALELWDDEHVPERACPEEHDGLGDGHGLHDGVGRGVGEGVEVNVHVHLLGRELDVVDGAGLLGEVGGGEPFPGLPLLRPPLLRQEPALPEHGDEVGPEHESVQLGHAGTRAVEHGKPVVACVPQRLDDGGHLLDDLQRDGAGLGGGELADGDVLHPGLRLGLEEGEALEVEDDLVDAGVEGVADGLGDEEHEHGDGEEEQVVGELEEDDAERDGHAHGPRHERGGAEHRVEAVVDARPAAEQQRRDAAVRGAHEDDGQEEAGRDRDAEGEEAEHDVDGEEDEERVEPELAGCPRGEDVARRVHVGGVEKGGEVVVVASRAVELLEVSGLARARARLAERRVARRAGDGEREHVEPGRGEDADGEREGQLRHAAARVDEVVEAEHLVEDVVVERAEEAAEHADERDGEEVADVVPHGHVADVEEDEPALTEHAAPPLAAHLDEPAQDDDDGGRGEEGAPQQRAPPPRGHLLQREQHAADGGTERGAHPRRGAARDEVAPVAVVVEVAQPPPFQTPPAFAALAQQVRQARADVHQGPFLPQIETRRHGADAADDLHDQLREAEHVGRVDAVQVGLDLRDSRAGCGRREDDAEHGGDEGQREVDAGEVEEARPVPLLADQVHHVQHLEARDVLDGQVDQRRDHPRQEPHQERHRPFQEDVLQHLHVRPAPPVVLEQVVLDDPVIY
ncbi:hypothetical protein EJB05_01795 [Eragrostis curvula]|uniref:Uncharacterized protein n=1 Tax=Eragrostis curvula TaxID=38414 RepID=A0A5J9WT13_9POAL|nr:hypothetical protein EJB05_01795 [Eragrostis curvula]